MANYADNIPFMNYVNEKDVEMIKYELLNQIFFLAGNKSELEKAIAFARSNSDFEFDHHEVILGEDFDDPEKRYVEIKFNMEKNFSRVRFDTLIKIYEDHYAKKEYSYDIPESTKKSSNVVVAVVVVGIAVASLVLYKILN
jgi:hypothetical protein